MSWNQREVIRARRAILDAVQGMVSGAVSPIEGARIIAAQCFAARLEDDPDILRFVGIASETEALPLGNDRRHWRAQALADLQSEIDEAQRWAHEVGANYCENLLARSESLLRWPD